jgi:hypothetical protein
MESSPGPEEFVREGGLDNSRWHEPTLASVVYGDPSATFGVPTLDCVSDACVWLHCVAHSVTPANDYGKVAVVNQRCPMSLRVLSGQLKPE